MDSKYNHHLIEKDKYQNWLDQKLFTANPKSKKPKFCIVLPPPNVTGQLHLGHAWDGTLQDLLIRYKKLKGFETLFVPGTDHAGIATQVKVMGRIKAETGLLLKDLDKKTFLDYAWKWKAEYNNIIHEQWAKLGLALDYSREKFTLDADINQAVNQVFVKLYNQGLIYQGTKIVNWDPELKTAISNIEVNHKEVKGKLYYFKYYLEDKSAFLSVATSRPETVFSDQAIIVNTKDKRYHKFIGKLVINPVNNQTIKVIGDDYVDMEFGSGAMKCTPAHDFNDYELGIKYHLLMPICFDEAGIMNHNAGKYQGQDRFVCRKNVVKDLNQANLVDKIVDHMHQVGYSERTNVVVEPYLSKQWFIKMDQVAKLILAKQNQSKEKVVFIPKMFEDQLLTWLDNIQDWCISRQLWWGHQIPVWYHNETKEIYVDIKPPKNINDYTQDNDVLDTWFSSSLWPLVTLNWPQDKALEFSSFYPTNVLVTAYDILFFWVVRMMFMGLELTNQKPFNHVLIHGLIRDEQGRKMSKSLNNGINPIEVIEQYGTDALRYFFVSNCAPGQDLRFSLTKIEASWNLINKLWNAARYVLLNLPSDFKLVDDLTKLELSHVDHWILDQFNSLLTKIEKNMEQYEFVLVTHDLNNFIWNQYCAWYIELSKFNLQDEKLKAASLQTLAYILKQIIIILHPFMPFVTEEIYHRMGLANSILQDNYPTVLKHKSTESTLWFVNNLMAITSALREVRKELNLGFKTKLAVHLNTLDNNFKDSLVSLNQYLLTLINSEIISVDNQSLVTTKKISKIITNAILEIPSENLVNSDEELNKFKMEKTKIENEIARSNKILDNEQFLKKAAPIKVQQEKDKLQEYQKQLEFIKVKIKEFN